SARFSFPESLLASVVTISPKVPPAPSSHNFVMTLDDLEVVRVPHFDNVGPFRNTSAEIAGIINVFGHRLVGSKPWCRGTAQVGDSWLQMDTAAKSLKDSGLYVDMS